MANPFDNLDDFVATALEELHVPGLALAVIDGDKIWTHAYGVADIETGAPVTTKTLFSTGSTTKAFTAAVTSRLIDENPDITWDTPVHRLIPDDFVLQDDWATTHVTIADCLSHRSGMPGHRTTLGGTSLKENVRTLRDLPLGDYSPRVRWEYSNHMYWAVSHVIEETYGKGLGEVMKEKIWGPLGMDSTFFSIEDALEHAEKAADPEVRMAKHHVWDSEAKAHKARPFWDDRGISGAGCMVSSVEDYAKWIKALIKKEDNAPLSAAGYAAVSTPQMVSPPVSPRCTGPISYGFGWWIGVYRGERVIFHPGGVIGSVANMIYFPDRNFGVTGMCCGASDKAMDAALWRLIDDFLGTPEDKRVDAIEQGKKIQAMAAAMNEGARERLYPALPAAEVAYSLPPAEYVGSYTHPAYGTIILTGWQSSSELVGKVPGRMKLDPFELEHITGEHFLVKADVIPGTMSIRTRARFEIGSSGKPLRLGVEFEDGNPDIVIWFAPDKNDAKDEEEAAENPESKDVTAVLASK